MEDIGPMLQAQFAIFKPYSDTGLKMAALSTRLRGKKGIQLSKATCLWLSRTTTGIASVR